jgi:hypothetical protein
MGHEPPADFQPYAVQLGVVFRLISIDVKNDIASVAVRLCNLSEQEAVVNVHGVQIMRQIKGLSPEVQPFCNIN